MRSALTVNAATGSITDAPALTSGAFDAISLRDPQLGQALASVSQKLEQAGVSTSARRVALAAEHADELGPDELYRFLDPGRVIEELEEVKAHQTRRIAAIRNALALAPLLLTWLALAFASVEYARCTASARPGVASVCDVHQPFLILWQQGFHGTTPFTFSLTAGLDFFLLALVLVFTIWAQMADARATRSARELGVEVDAIVAGLISAARAGVIVPRNSDPKDWAAVVQATITRALDEFTVAIGQTFSTTETFIRETHAATIEMTDGAKRVVESIGTTSAAMLEQQLRPVLLELNQTVSDLRVGVTAYNQSMSTIGSSVNMLGDTAHTLATASQSIAGQTSAYASTASSIDSSIQHLDATQQQFVELVRVSAADMAKAASAVDILAAKVNADMVSNLKTASSHLANVNLQIHQTAQALSATTASLARAAQTLEVASANALRARLGLLGWLFGRSGRAPASFGQSVSQSSYSQPPYGSRP